MEHRDVSRSADQNLNFETLDPQYRHNGLVLKFQIFAMSQTQGCYCLQEVMQIAQSGNG